MGISEVDQSWRRPFTMSNRPRRSFATFSSLQSSITPWLQSRQFST